jgi:hypothetical protein
MYKHQNCLCLHTTSKLFKSLGSKNSYLCNATIFYLSLHSRGETPCFAEKNYFFLQAEGSQKTQVEAITISKTSVRCRDGRWRSTEAHNLSRQFFISPAYLRRTSSCKISVSGQRFFLSHFRHLLLLGGRPEPHWSAVQICWNETRTPPPPYLRERASTVASNSENAKKRLK